MKKIIFAFVLLLTSAVSANAMSYEQARDQALFLTDKMAYELDLTEEQYEAAYEINLDYLMSINAAADVYADYWTRRNLDLSYVLLDWQYRTFCGLDYFYRPLYWGDGFWHFRIYAHYERRDYFFFGYPHCYVHYHGGHAWHVNGGRSWYHGHTYHHGGIGMRGGWDRGGYRHMDRGWHSTDGGHRGFDRNSPAHSGSRNHGGIEYNRGGNSGSYNRGGNSGSYNRGGNSGSYNRGGNSGSYNRGNHSYDRGNRGSESSRPSSTRTTVGERSHQSSGSYSPSRSFSGGSRSSSTTSRPSYSGSPSRSSSGSFGGGHSTGGRSGGHSGGSFGAGHSGGGFRR